MPMSDRLSDLLSNLFAFDVTADLLGRDFVQQALLAAAVLALSDSRLAKRLDQWRARQTKAVAARPKD